jgi:L-rhamnonate dehydratase
LTYNFLRFTVLPPLHQKEAGMTAPRIKAVRTYLVGSGGGDYFSQKQGHWLIDTLIANPMSGYKDYKASRTSWGINIMGSIVVEIESESGHVGLATGFGGEPACWLVQHHFRRFLDGADPRDLNRLWDQMFRASMYYGRKGLTLATISVVDLALWDLIGKIREEPVYKLIGGRTKDEITFYCTGPRPEAARRLGFWGGKVPLPHGPGDGIEGLRANVAFLKAHRETVGPDYPLMVDCYMALDVPYAIELATACRDLDIYWWEEVLHPDDFDGYALLKRALPATKWTTGEHEYSRYGFRKLIEGRNIDILQPDVMWVGGLTELLRISAHAAAYDIPVVPHGSGPFSYHFVMSQPHSPYCEYVANSADGQSVLPVFGPLFSNEPVPENGRLDVPDTPGFGLIKSPDAVLMEAGS